VNDVVGAVLILSIFPTIVIIAYLHERYLEIRDEINAELDDRRAVDEARRELADRYKQTRQTMIDRWRREP
jgi:hypothetical protein